MQKEKTIQFWNDYYRNEESKNDSTASTQQKNKNNKKEWIVEPTTELLHTIQTHCNILFQKDPLQQHNEISILEIGCGTSIFGLTLWEYLLLLLKQSSSLSPMSIQYHATDVSPVCIQQNKLRDDARILHILQSIQSTQEDTANHNHSFQYHLLDILNPLYDKNDSMTRVRMKQYHLILDKGCLDTFLFRTKSKLSSCSTSGSSTSSSNSSTNDTERDETLMTRFFHNVHSLLMDDNENGKYILFSPRSKIKQVRDFNGFSSVQKIKLDTSSSGISFGDLDGKGKDINHSKHAVYMYICTKNSHYSIGKGDAFSSFVETNRCNGGSCSSSSSPTETRKSPKEDESCTKCQISFYDFRNGENMVQYTKEKDIGLGDGKDI